MRKVLIATIVGMVLFAVGAFAANLDLTAENVASGSKAVGACNQNPKVNFTSGAFSNGDWDIDSATVLATNCEGATVKVVLLDGPGGAVLAESQAGTMGATSGTVNFTGTKPKVNPSKFVSVLLDGIPLTP
jgi:hypothetical protein